MADESGAKKIDSSSNKQGGTREVRTTKGDGFEKVEVINKQMNKGGGGFVVITTTTSRNLKRDRGHAAPFRLINGSE